MGKYLNGVTVWMEGEEHGPMEYSYENIDDACEGVRHLYREVLAANDGVRRTISLIVPEPDDGDDMDDALRDHDG